MIILLWSIEPKIDWNRLSTRIVSKNLVAIMMVRNSAFRFGHLFVSELLTIMIMTRFFDSIVGNN